MNINLLLLLGLGLSLFSSCFEYDDVDYQGYENATISESKEGIIQLSFNLKLNNPNKFKIKIKPSELTVFIGDEEMGQAKLNKTLVIDKRSSKSYPIQIDVKLTDLIKAGSGNLLKLASKKTIKLRIKGLVKGSVYGITQKRAVDKTKEIETAEFLKVFGI